VITNQDGRKNMLKLAERMCISFCAGVSASTAHTWTTLSGTGADDVRVMTRKSVDDPGRPAGIVLSAATSFWLPVTPKRVFEFLRDENSRSEVRNQRIILVIIYNEKTIMHQSLSNLKFLGYIIV
jgi:homeobox-leucine zipper protein